MRNPEISSLVDEKQYLGRKSYKYRNTELYKMDRDTALAFQDKHRQGWFRTADQSFIFPLRNGGNEVRREKHLHGGPSLYCFTPEDKKQTLFFIAKVRVSGKQ